MAGPFRSACLQNEFPNTKSSSGTFGPSKEMIFTRVDVSKHFVEYFALFFLCFLTHCPPKDWFARLKTVVLQAESDKWSDRVVAQLGTDSMPMFKANRGFCLW